MRLALDAAREVKGTTLPNPAVGAVIVKRGRVIGSGATSPCGGPHAERHALAAAGCAARGADMYVTLEPCCHFGRTPPCTDAIIAAGISRVFVALRDPDSRVSGKGMAQLRRRGVVVSCGCMRKEAALLNEDFIYAVTNNRAFITLKLALTLDGYIADADGHSKWITSAEQRKEVHALRGMHAAVAVGRGTLEADDPHLDVRYGRKRRPVRIVFTSSDTVSPGSFFYTHAHQTRSIVVVRGKGDRHSMIDAASGIEYWFTGESDAHKSMEVFTRMAAAAEIVSVFVEGGATVGAAFLEAGLVNRLHLFYGNKILGGGRPGIMLGRGLPIDKCINLRECAVRVIGGGVCLSGIPGPSPLLTTAVHGKK